MLHLIIWGLLLGFLITTLRVMWRNGSHKATFFFGLGAVILLFRYMMWILLGI